MRAETLIYLNTRPSRRQSDQVWHEPFILCWEETHENDFDKGGNCNLTWCAVLFSINWMNRQLIAVDQQG